MEDTFEESDESVHITGSRSEEEEESEDEAVLVRRRLSWGLLKGLMKLCGGWMDGYILVIFSLSTGGGFS